MIENLQAAQSRKLAPEQQSFYADSGYFSPQRVFDTEEANEFRRRYQEYFDRYEDRMRGLLQRERRVYLTNTHLFLEWAHRIVSHTSVLDAVESVLGPNILVWSSHFFTKLPGDRAYVSWHQDGTYWGLHPPNVTTAWIALSDSVPANGCMRVVAGTHNTPKLPQRETYAPDNMLSRGQEIAMEVDEARAVDLILQPGEMSLHHIGIVHGSDPNTSDRARIGFAIRYITPEVMQDGEARDIALLVRGKDEHGHFDLAEPPQRDTRPEESSIHAESLRRNATNVLPKSPPSPVQNS